MNEIELIPLKMEEVILSPACQNTIQCQIHVIERSVRFRGHFIITRSFRILGLEITFAWDFSLEPNQLPHLSVLHVKAFHHVSDQRIRHLL